MDWAYDQNDIATYYNIYSEMIKFWNKIIPNFIVNLDYDILISNCELNWDDNCLNHHKNKNIINTTSNVQVRKKIYTSSKNSYLNYERHLSKMFDVLKF